MISMGGVSSLHRTALTVSVESPTFLQKNSGLTVSRAGLDGFTQLASGLHSALYMLIRLL